ncbi:MAG: ribonuclease H-like domain-containing protein, partial [Planctomycetota bacterium]|nr:ribonuclease H-like domain-containing protein [Planctomycetota bacterium]
DNFILLSGDAQLDGLDPSRAVYLDTETTGLSGGAGVFVYMVGLASFTDRGLEVWQGFMDGPEQEAALLTEVARRIQISGGVVSFFGKSFDRHRLQDKMSIHGIDSPFEDRPHLDLYHPLRRLHRGVYKNSRLQTMEHVLCGLNRSDDLPGSLAPEAWFDYLADRPHRLEGVFRHNCDDVLSLVTLLAWLARVDDREPDADAIQAEAARELALCEAMQGQKAFRNALQRSKSFLDRFDSKPNSTESKWESANQHCHALRLVQAESQRRLHLGEASLQTLEPILALPEPGVSGVKAAVLAAKVLEHEIKDKPASYAMCQRALKELGSLRAFQGRPALERDVRKRALRLAKQLGQESS